MTYTNKTERYKAVVAAISQTSRTITIVSLHEMHLPNCAEDAVRDHLNRCEPTGTFINPNQLLEIARQLETHPALDGEMITLLLDVANHLISRDVNLVSLE